MNRRRPLLAVKKIKTFSSQAMVESDSARSALMGSSEIFAPKFGVHGAIGGPEIFAPKLGVFARNLCPEIRTPSAAQKAAEQQESQLLRVVTVNVTSAGMPLKTQAHQPKRGLKQYLLTTDAHVVMAKEVKTSGAKTVLLQDWARRNGWKALIADAIYCPETKAHRAGVAVFARDYLGLSWPPGRGPTCHESRLIAVMVESPGLPAMLCLSVYLQTGVGGASPYNLGLLEYAGRITSFYRMPWIMGGDYQMTAEALARTLFPEAAGARILTDRGPAGTCVHAHGSSSIDHFLASDDIASVATDAQARLDACTSPHRPVQICIPAGAGQLQKLAVVQVQRLPNDPVFGPRLPKPSWVSATKKAFNAVRIAQQSTSAAKIQHALAVAYRTFAETAESELADITGVELKERRRKRGRKICTRWVPIIGEQKKPLSPEGVALRWLTRRARELVRCAQGARWEQFSAVSNSQQMPAWMPASLTDDFQSVWALANQCKPTEPAGAPEEAVAFIRLLDDRADELELKANEAEASDDKACQKAWRLWVRTALQGGGKKAHTWAKGPTAWIPVQVSVDGVVSASPQAHLQAELTRCTALWRAASKEERPALLPPEQRTALPRLTADQIREAGLASSAAKATAFDGFHPRHLGHLCSEGREVAAILWEACETASLVPPQVRDVAAPLIPKKNGSLRDLGLFAGFLRVCTKARGEVCRQWERENDRPFFACGAARSTTDTVWRAAVRAEAAQASGQAAAAVLQDMEAFYQSVDHEKLLLQAALHGFPLPLLRLALHLYRGPRHLLLGRGVAPPAWPTRGVLPGCAWAGTLVKVYYLTALDAFTLRHPRVELDVYVDDIQLAAQGTESAVVDLLAEATLDLNDVVEKEIRSKLVPAKAAVVASTAKLAKRVRAALGSLAGAPVEVTEALGVDFAAGRARREYKRSSRIRDRVLTAAKRRGRLRILSKFGGKAAKKMVTQGATPAALYGVAVTGISNDLLLQVRRTAACAVPPYASGRSLDLTLQLAEIDPGPAAAGAPLVRWAQEIWQATLPVPSRAIPTHELVRAWHAVQARPPKGWAQCRGPIGAAALSAKRLGWDVGHPWKWRTDNGIEFSLLEASPRLIEWHIRQTWSRITCCRVADNLRSKGFDTTETIDLTSARQVIKSNAADSLTPFQKGALRAVVCDAVWTKERFLAAGYIVDPVCDLCRDKPDTLFHRLWECECEAVSELRKQVLPVSLIREARRAGAGSAAFCRGLGPSIAALVPPPLDDGGVLFTRNGAIVEDRALWTLCGDVFYDGSCFQRGSNELNRATWAAIQMDADNKVVACVSGPVWAGLPQSAQAAEHCARTAAVELLNGPSRLIGDSKNIVEHAKRPLAKACHHSRMHAAASRMAACSTSAGHVLEDVWVRAHRKPESEADPWDRYTAIGNDFADTEAVAAQTRLEHDGTPQWKAVAAAKARARTICRAIGIIASLWPSAKQACGTAERVPVAPVAERRAQVAEHRHTWAHSNGRWTCENCLTFAHSDAKKVLRSGEHCPGYSASMSAMLGGERGHAFAAVELESGPPLILCLRCGGWAARNAVGLKEDCPPAPHPGGKQALRRIARGQHPSFYGAQPRVLAVIPFGVNENLMGDLRRLQPAPKTRVAAPTAVGSFGGERALARLDRVRARAAAHSCPEAKRRRGNAQGAEEGTTQQQPATCPLRAPPPPPQPWRGCLRRFGWRAATWKWSSEAAVKAEAKSLQASL